MLGRCRRSRLLGDGKGEIGVGLRVGCFNGGPSPQFYAGLKITSLVSANISSLLRWIFVSNRRSGEVVQVAHRSLVR
jgi:hypothetical protein